jgi:hypothetical protein
VWLRGLPVGLHELTTEHSEELQREFALLRATVATHQDDHSAGTPARLLDLIQQLSAAYQGVAEEPRRLIDEAIERGDETIDLVYRVPAEVGDACLRLDALFAEADEFCRAGAHLLTLETPLAASAYRTWFLHQFAEQIAGHPAKAWNDWARVHAPLALGQP